MNDFKSRLLVEVTELKNKVEKLENFIDGDIYDTLPEIDRTDLKEQLNHMKNYLLVLNRRVSRQC